MLTLLSACAGSATATSDGDAPFAAQRWQVSLSVSGGLRGTVQTLQVWHDGRLSAIDHKQRIKRSGRLTAARRDRIEGLLATIADPSAQATNNAFSRCADCLQYELEISANGRRHVARADSLAIADSPHAALVETLVMALREALE